MSTFRDFCLAKQYLNNIFLGILDYGTSAYEYLLDLNEKYPDVIDGNEPLFLLDYTSKVEEIRQVFTSAHMKVAFFGSARSGKSTVINALLGENVLPGGIGHTTNGFLQVEGSHTGNAYVAIGDIIPTQHYVESNIYLANILKNVIKPNENQLVHVCWPKETCKLLRDDVALVDTQGLDTISCNMDQWIVTHCIDADVFVLVVDAEFTLMDTEINFLHTISKKLPNPNIFVLINCWDEFESFDQEHKLQIKHSIDLLEQELKICTPHEPYSRMFFISAKEVLQFREEVRNELWPNTEPIFSERYLEFQDFESQLEDCISRSALSKFLFYSMDGNYLLSEMNKIMDITNIRSQEQIYLKVNQINEIQDKINVTEEHLKIITNTNSPTPVVNGSFRFDDSLAAKQNLSSMYRVLDRVLSIGTAALKFVVLAEFLKLFKRGGLGLMIATGTFYSIICLYYEYLSCKIKAKNHAFKKQNVDYVNSKLVESANCSQQVQQELSTSLVESGQLVNELAINLNDEMENLEPELHIFTITAETPTIFTNNEPYWLNEEFNQFDSFLMDRIFF